MIRRAAEVSAHERLDIEFADGHVSAEAEGRERKPASEPEAGAETRQRKSGHIAVSRLASQQQPTLW